MKATLMRCGGSGACGGGLTGVVEGAVVLEQHHLAVEVDDLLARPHELLLGLLPGHPGHEVLQLLLQPTGGTGSPNNPIRSRNSATIG